VHRDPAPPSLAAKRTAPPRPPQAAAEGFPGSCARTKEGDQPSRLDRQKGLRRAWRPRTGFVAWWSMGGLTPLTLPSEKRPSVAKVPGPGWPSCDDWARNYVAIRPPGGEPPGLAPRFGSPGAQTGRRSPAACRRDSPAHRSDFDGAAAYLVSVSERNPVRPRVPRSKGLCGPAPDRRGPTSDAPLRPFTKRSLSSTNPPRPG